MVFNSAAANIGYVLSQLEFEFWKVNRLNLLRDVTQNYVLSVWLSKTDPTYQNSLPCLFRQLADSADRENLRLTSCWF